MKQFPDVVKRSFQVNSIQKPQIPTINTSLHTTNLTQADRFYMLYWVEIQFDIDTEFNGGHWYAWTIGSTSLTPVVQITTLKGTNKLALQSFVFNQVFIHVSVQSQASLG